MKMQLFSRSCNAFRIVYFLIILLVCASCNGESYEDPTDDDPAPPDQETFGTDDDESMQTGELGNVDPVDSDGRPSDPEEIAPDVDENFESEKITEEEREPLGGELPPDGDFDHSIDVPEPKRGGTGGTGRAAGKDGKGAGGEGGYCSVVGCCVGRNDDCSTPFSDTFCYCDLFCNRTSVSDCCPDYATHCVRGGVADQPPEFDLNKLDKPPESLTRVTSKSSGALL